MHPETLSSKLLLLTGWCTFLAPSVAGAADATAQQQIESAEQTVGKAFGMSDFAALQKYWSPQMLVNSPANDILTRDDVFAAILENKLSYSGYTIDTPVSESRDSSKEN